MGRAFAMLMGVLVVGVAARAQDVVFPGSTVQGDIARGQGQFLKGAAWYELYSARGRAIDADTERRNADWLRRNYVYDMAQRAARIQRKHYKSQQAYERARQEAAKKEERWRTAPTADDVRQGDALNALLSDLSNPLITTSAWRTALVSLPEGLSIRSLVFQFAPKSRDKGSLVLGSSLIALGRLDPDRWPSLLKGPELAAERRAYESAYRTIVDESLGGRLDYKAVFELDRTVDGLDKGVRSKIPTGRNYRSTAIDALNVVKKAAKMFDAETLDYTREMISDTHRHEAHSVGELVAFMRKYRLVFASAEKNPADGESYQALYGLLREQKEKLGLPLVPAPVPAPSEPEGGPTDALVVGRWRHTPLPKIVDMRPGGAIVMGQRVIGSWTRSGSKLVLRWPHPQAPGGVWVDEVEVSYDGKSYSGKNQNGGFIRGDRIAAGGTR